MLNDSRARAVLAYGGSRSGKTRAIVEWIVRATLAKPGLRVMMARAKRVDAKLSLWRETLLGEVLASYPSSWYEVNKSDLVVEINTQPPSEIWVDGLQEKERIERILGRGLGLAYLNEASQISYEAYTTVRTRLSQVIPQWRHLVVVDENPPGPQHWTHRIFIEHLEPRDRRALDPARYRAIRINPDENPHLPPGFVEQLEDLPEDQRARFMLGMWRAPAGSIYARLLNDDTWTTEEPVCERYVVGVDLVTYSAVLVGLQRRQVRGRVRWSATALDEIVLPPGSIASEMDRAIRERWAKWRPHAYLDHNLGKGGMREIRNSSLASKDAGSVEAGIAQLQRMMEQGLFRAHERCTALRYELENYRRDEAGQIVKEDDHLCDALRYAAYSATRRAPIEVN